MAPPPRPPVICYDLHSNSQTTRRRHLESLPTFSRPVRTRPASAVRIKTAPPIPPQHLQPPRVVTRHISNDAPAKTITQQPRPQPLQQPQPQPQPPALVRSKILTPLHSNYTTENLVNCSTPRGDHCNKPPRSAKKVGQHVTINVSPCKTPLPEQPRAHKFVHPSPIFCTTPVNNDTLEVTDIRFFETVEDKTMMDLDRMIARLPNLQSLKNL